MKEQLPALPDKENIHRQDVPTVVSSASSKSSKAVAVKYEKGKDPAPRIVASGKGGVAEQIVQLAFAHGVKVREDAELVEILAQIDVDSIIPLEAYTAVAEILSYVYRANSNLAAQGNKTSQTPKNDDIVEVTYPEREWEQSQT